MACRGNFRCPKYNTAFVILMIYYLLTIVTFVIKQHMHKMNVAEIRLLRWTCGKIENIESGMSAFRDNVKG